MSEQVINNSAQSSEPQTALHIDGPVTSMAKELCQLRSDFEKLKSEYVRSLADFDNYRRRKEKEFADFRERATEALLLELVPVLDNFERALAATETCDSVDGIRKGIKLIHGQLRDALARVGFSVYSCQGEEFDPRRCEAVSFVETDEQPENIVVEEIAKGYVCYGRVLRPSMVCVTRRKTKTAEEKGESKDAHGNKPDA